MYASVSALTRRPMLYFSDYEMYFSAALPRLWRVNILARKRILTYGGTVEQGIYHRRNRRPQMLKPEQVM